MRRTPYPGLYKTPRRVDLRLESDWRKTYLTLLVLAFLVHPAESTRNKCHFGAYAVPSIQGPWLWEGEGDCARDKNRT
jgi:hypothetical protein